MEKNFFEDRLQNASQGYKMKTGLIVAVIATVIGIISLINIGIKNNILSFLLFCVVCAGVIYLILGMINREKKIIEKYSGDNRLNALMLYDETENVQDVYNYINNAITNNEILFRHRAFPKERKNLILRGKRDNNNETIVLPKYVLDCTYWTVMAIPINKVRVIAEKDYFDDSVFNYDGFEYDELKSKLRDENVLSMKDVVSIYYGNEKAIGIDAGSYQKAEKLAQEINMYL